MSDDLSASGTKATRWHHQLRHLAISASGYRDHPAQGRRQAVRQEQPLAEPGLASGWVNFGVYVYAESTPDAV